LVAFLWGLAEATVFFVVPDVLLTWLALRRGIKRALAASLWATLGSLLGGTIVAVAAAHGAAPPIARIYAHLPGIDSALIQRAAEDLSAQGNRALFFGSVTGVPYKLFALAAGRDQTLAGFLAASSLARWLRFAAACALAAWIRRTSQSLDRQIAWGRWHAGFWIAFYAIYWGTFHG
jgi:membrane protein YqaA with SNARE-associated domain